MRTYGTLDAMVFLSVSYYRMTVLINDGTVRAVKENGSWVMTEDDLRAAMEHIPAKYIRAARGKKCRVIRDRRYV